MKRNAISDLVQWKNNPEQTSRDRGARQVGKHG